ncbi:MAG: L,D-transpeptidase [Verrucomicrobia bacterium]|nr:L,D-transpeptidase [Verrucomicrobiota bacterium]
MFQSLFWEEHGERSQHLYSGQKTQPASRGCIRMRNQDAIQLFDLIDTGTEVEILP